MALIRYPHGVRGNDGQILRDSVGDLPADNILRSEMDDGYKQRPQFTRGLSRFQGAVKMPASEFEIYRQWVRDDLKDGTRAWGFYHPKRKYLVAATFVPQDRRAFTPTEAPGGWVIVNFELDYIDRAVV